MGIFRTSGQAANVSTKAVGFVPLNSPNDKAGSRRFFCSLVAVSLVLAIFVRMAHLGVPGFPLGEGGLFVEFSAQILKHNFWLPAQVSYGEVTFPFAYPPLGFYVAALTSKLTGLNILQVLYFLPIILNFSAIPAFAFLCVQVLKSKSAAVCATLAYVHIAESFIWQITGGGLPRSLGALLGIMAVALAYRARKDPRYALPVAGLLTGLTILAHLEWGIFASSGVTLALLTNRLSRRGVGQLCIAGVISAVVITPWLSWIVISHGLAPFRSSSSASEWDNYRFLRAIITCQIFGILTWPAILGSFVAFKRRNWLLLMWPPLTLLLTPRMAAAAGLAIPTAMLTGLGIAFVSPRINKAIRDNAAVSRVGKSILCQRWFLSVDVTALAIISAIILFLISPAKYIQSDFSVVKQISTEDRQAMNWASRNTPLESSFLVLSDAREWWADRHAEWFPLLAKRTSVTTVQGLEWAGPGLFSKKKQEIGVIKHLQANAPAQIPTVLGERFCYTHVAVFSSHGSGIRSTIEESHLFEAIYRNTDALIARRIGRNGGCLSG